MVTEVRPPAQSRLVDWYRGADLLDAFSIPLPGAAAMDIRSVGQVVLGDPAPWFSFLLAIRDGVVARLGIQTSSEIRSANDGRERIDFFPIVSTHDDELILGEDDRHLDVRISLLVQRGEGRSDEVIATTAVRCHNLLGHAYLLAIGPFHRLAVRSYLRRAATSALPITVDVGRRGVPQP
jgi:hypothetical protein